MKIWVFGRFIVPLLGDIKISNVMQGKIDELLELLLSQIVLEALCVELLSVLKRHQSILGERIVDKIQNCNKIQEETK
jgi:hypothetical protein